MRSALLAIGWALVAAAECRADVSFLGGFRPVAAEEGARSLWVNPAAIGVRGGTAAVAEVVWHGEDDLRLGDVRRMSAAVSLPLTAYGAQWDLSDETGRPDWTVAWGRKLPAGSLSFGFDLEWRGGEDSALDVAAGALVPWKEWTIGAAGTHLTEPTTEGVEARRTWQLGAAWRPRRTPARITYDAVLEREAGARHWFGIGFDRARRLQLAFAMNTDADWSATADVVLGSHLAGIGARDVDPGSRREFAAWEWKGEPQRHTRGPR